MSRHEMGSLSELGIAANAGAADALSEQARQKRAGFLAEQQAVQPEQELEEEPETELEPTKLGKPIPFDKRQ